MANKQTVPLVQSGGAHLKKKVQNVSFLRGKQSDRIVEGDDRLGILEILTDSGKSYVKQRLKTDEERMLLKADNTLKAYRNLLLKASNPEEFKEIAKDADKVLSAQLDNGDFSADFWAKNGAKLLEANKTDVGRLYEMKSFDFGRNSLDCLLADNQNLLARSSGEKGQRLLEKGAEEISVSPFLGKQEKEEYRRGYLKTGILNMALNDPDGADKAVEKYFARDDDLKVKIAEIRHLNEMEVKHEEENNARNNYILELKRALGLWQEKERGNLSNPAFYVLQADKDGEMLWGDKGLRTETPLWEAYKLVKRLNAGDKLRPEELRDAGNYFISAYRQGKIGLEEAAGLQNQLLLCDTGAGRGGILFDREIDNRLDDILLPDVTENDDDSRDFMEEKAKFAFEVYDAYYARKVALTDEWNAAGGMITPAVLRRFSRQAAKEVFEELGVKENADGSLIFEELRDEARRYYTGKNMTEIWRRFCVEAPFREDKKELMAKIARSEEKKTLCVRGERKRLEKML